jgi:hypothetical protein
LLATSVIKEAAEQVYMAGLLHDFGRLVLCRLYPEPYAAALKASEDQGTDLQALEREIFGLTHSDVTREVLAQWKLPTELVEAASHHHTSAEQIKSKLRDPRSALVVALANGLAHAMASGDSGGSTLVPIDEYAMALGLGREILESIAKQGVTDAEDTELFCAARSNVDFRCSLHVELSRQIEGVLPMTILASPNRCNPVTLFLRQLGWLSRERPQLAVVYLADRDEAQTRYAELSPLDAQFGGPIPILVISPGGSIEIPAELAAGRRCTTASVPGRYTEIITAIKKLIAC